MATSSRRGRPITPVDPGTMNGNAPVDVIRAATIAAQILRAGKVASWPELAGAVDVRARVELTPQQDDLLRQAQPLLAWLSVQPKRLPYQCGRCSRIGFFGSSNPPSRCVLTMGCEGAPIKTKLAVRN